MEPPLFNFQCWRVFSAHKYGRMGILLKSNPSQSSQNQSAINYHFVHFSTARKKRLLA